VSPEIHSIFFEPARVVFRPIRLQKICIHMMALQIKEDDWVSHGSLPYPAENAGATFS